MSLLGRARGGAGVVQEGPCLAAALCPPAQGSQGQLPPWEHRGIQAALTPCGKAITKGSLFPSLPHITLRGPGPPPDPCHGWLEPDSHSQDGLSSRLFQGGQSEWRWWYSGVYSCFPNEPVRPPALGFVHRIHFPFLILFLFICFSFICKFLG